MPRVMLGAGDTHWRGRRDLPVPVPHPNKIHNGLAGFCRLRGMELLEEDGTSEVGSVFGVDLETWSICACSQPASRAFGFHLLTTDSCFWLHLWVQVCREALTAFFIGLGAELPCVLCSKGLIFPFAGDYPSPVWGSRL